VEKTLNQSYPECQTKIVIFDANLSPSSSLEQDIVDKVKELKLSVLINNIGGTAGVQRDSEIYSTIDKMIGEAVAGLLNINARFTSQLSALLLPLLCSRPRSLMMNISSVADFGMPYLSVTRGQNHTSPRGAKLWPWR
jgi:17beta-estradiol 17-dehydrogenase / very-long-chain 3-oxoacyl-CoA reductase